MMLFSILFLYLILARDPNIVVILLDDTGFGDISYYKQPCQEDYQCPTEPTPNIDKVLSTGAAFTSFYASHCVCSPSRAGLLTGRLPIRTGVYPSVFNPASIHGLPEKEITLAALLSTTRQYRTAMVGKWHLGHLHQYNPVSHGFDSYYGIPWSHDYCPCPCNLTNTEDCSCRDSLPGCPVYSNYEVVEQPADLPTLTAQYTDKAVDYITKQYTEDKPFFYYLAYQHSHHPQFHSSSFNTSKRGAYGDSMAEMDHSVGRVMDAIAKDPYGNTLVFLTSDNGADLPNVKFAGSAGVYRCGKGTTWEGGQRVVGAVWWPSRIAPKVVDHVASNMDIFATVASVLAINKPLDRVYDGHDLSEFIFSNETHVANGPDAQMFYYGLSWRLHAIRVGDYKAHFFTARWGNFPANGEMCQNETGLISHDPPLLYDLRTSPNENYPVNQDSDEYREVMLRINGVRSEHDCNAIHLNTHNLCENQFGPDNIWSSDAKAEPWKPASGLPYTPEYPPNGTSSSIVRDRIPFCGSQDEILEGPRTCAFPERVLA